MTRIKHHLAMFLVVLLGCITFCSSAYNLKNLNGFKCPKVTRMNQAIRLNEKLEVECFSINGSQCAGFTGERSCRTYIKYNINKLRAIRCPKESNEGWCIKARKFYFNRWMCRDETGLNTGIRLSSTGRVQCLSKSGKDCAWGAYGNKLCQMVKKCPKTRRKIIPLTCGNNHKKVWSHTGYHFATGHWCKTGFAFYFYSGNWLCKRQTGISTPVRLAIDGEIECLSKNKRDCFWGTESSSQCHNLIIKYGKNENGLKCGKKHKKIYGGTGYRNTKHWCRKSLDLIYYFRISLIYIFSGFRIPVNPYVPNPPRPIPVNPNVPNPPSPNPVNPNVPNPPDINGGGIIKINISRITRIKNYYIRIYGIKWRVILRKKWGIYWFWRLRYGIKWRYRLLILWGKAWKVKLRAWLKKFRLRWRLRIRSTGKWSIRWLRLRYSRIYGNRWRIILRQRWGIYWYWRLRFGIRWKWRLRKIYGLRWLIRLKRWLLRWNVRWQYRIQIRTKGRWSIRWVTRIYKQRLGFNWRITLRKRWGIYWYWRLRFGVRWRYRLQRLYGLRWMFHLKKWMIKWRHRWSLRVATTGKWSVNAMKIRYIRIYGANWRLRLRRRWGIYWYWRLRFGVRWRYRIRVIYGWRWQWHLRRWRTRWNLQFNYGTCFCQLWQNQMQRQYGWGWRIKLRVKYGAFWRYRVRYGVRWRVRIRILFPIKWKIMIRTSLRVHRRYKANGGCEVCRQKQIAARRAQRGGRRRRW